MQTRIADFNDATSLVSACFKAEWASLRKVLKAMPLHLKASDQSGITGTPIFDVKGTNAYLSKELNAADWKRRNLPLEHREWGRHADFERNGVVLEIQFSNYPFLANNLLRTEVFRKEKTRLGSQPVALLIVVCKAGMFPASQSTLYYEQAKAQLEDLEKHKLTRLPIRLVGLFSPQRTPTTALWTKYTARRHARKQSTQTTRECKLLPSEGRRRACSVQWIK